MKAMVGRVLNSVFLFIYTAFNAYVDATGPSR
jgi:hypothetical protein